MSKAECAICLQTDAMSLNGCFLICDKCLDDHQIDYNQKDSITALEAYQFLSNALAKASPEQRNELD